MNSESHRIWRNRNVYAFVAVLSVFLLLSALRQLFTYKNSDATMIVCSIIEVLTTGFLAIRCSNLASSADAQLWSMRDSSRSRLEDRLDELERLKRRAMVTPEEYEAKRKDILNDL